MTAIGVPQDTQPDGNIVRVHDPDSYEMLVKLFKEVRALRMQLDTLFDMESSEDIEESED